MTHGQNILIVDDEETIRTVMGDALASRGYRVEKAASASEGLAWLPQKDFALALIDLKLPGAMDGIGLLSEIRATSPQTIVIMLTGYGTLDSAIAAMRQGAHDYLLKPISMGQLIESVERGLEKKDEEKRRLELIARLESTLQELKLENAPPSLASSDRFVRASSLTIDRQKRLVVIGDQPLTLSSTEFDILDYLARHADRIVTANEILKAVQGVDVKEPEALPIVRVHVQRLRHKLKDDSDRPRYIATVRGKGYRFIG